MPAESRRAAKTPTANELIQEALDRWLAEPAGDNAISWFISEYKKTPVYRVAYESGRPEHIHTAEFRLARRLWQLYKSVTAQLVYREVALLVHPHIEAGDSLIPPPHVRHDLVDDMRREGIQLDEPLSAFRRAICFWVQLAQHSLWYKLHQPDHPFRSIFRHKKALPR